MTKTPMTQNFLRFKANEVTRLEDHLRNAVADLETELGRLRADLDKGQSTSVLNLLPKSARVHEYALRMTALKETLAELESVLPEESAAAGE